MEKKEDLKGFKYKNGNVYHGDCLRVMRKIPDNTYTGILTDPPYGLSFMGKDWDKSLPSKYVWKQAFRILKPGGILLCFGGTRTYHRLACMIEDAGFEIRDCMMWLYGSGFPKSHNISKSIDKKLKKTRKVVGISYTRNGSYSKNHVFKQATRGPTVITEPASKLAKEWQGYGTALKPAWEPILVAIKPFKGTIVDNAMAWGVAGLNIEECRIKTNENLARNFNSADNLVYGEYKKFGNPIQPSGRWPSNVILDEESSKILDKQSGIQKSGRAGKNSRSWGISGKAILNSNKKDSWKSYNSDGYGDVGGASRFFYCSKASKKEKGKFNTHPTCKPINLLEYLLKLIKMPKQTKILDPFCGSGSTLVAASNLDINCDGIEISKEYLDIIHKRLEK